MRKQDDDTDVHLVSGRLHSTVNAVAHVRSVNCAEPEVGRAFAFAHGAYLRVFVLLDAARAPRAEAPRELQLTSPRKIVPINIPFENRRHFPPAKSRRFRSLEKYVTSTHTFREEY